MFGSYSQYYNIFNSEKPYKKEIEFVYAWAEKPKSIFDIGAGTGNYWKYYPKGTDIFGIDKSRDMANQSKHIATADITKYRHTKEVFDCATALFDVINYIPKHDWWKHIPVKKGGYFIFDIWDKNKVDNDGFQMTSKTIKGVFRKIIPIDYNGKSVDLTIDFGDSSGHSQETHRMYVYSREDIIRFCGKEFEIVSVKPTKRWQTWYLCKRK